MSATDVTVEKAPRGLVLEPRKAPRAKWTAMRFRQALLDFFWQIVVMGGLFVIYRFGRVLSADKATEAFSHAEELWHIERWFRLPSEAWLQDVALNSQWFIETANHYYVTAHFPVTIALFVWLYARHRNQYRWARAVIIGASIPALLIQVGIPVAPPRMLSQYGILDTMAVYGPTAYPANRTGISNQFAALPSLHVAWAVLAAAMAWRMHHRIAQVMLTFHAAFTIVVVLITGNHYWVDGIFGVTLIAAAWMVRSSRWAENISAKWRSNATKYQEA